MNKVLWRSNLLVFLSLLFLVVGYFFWQGRLAMRQFKEQAGEHSQILAAVVERNINNVRISNKGLESVVTRFLENSARFVEYLDGIERFSESELSAFASESGLAGVRIIHQGEQEHLTVPRGWLPESEGCAAEGLSSRADGHLYVFALPEGHKAPAAITPGCILVGLSTGELDTLREELSVERLLRVLSGLRGIDSIRLEPAPLSSDHGGTVPSTELVREQGRLISKTVFPMGAQNLIVALAADDFAERMQQMRRQFGIFFVFLYFTGALSTWWLFRMQRLQVEQTRDYERKLARQHEEASLGRAAETITHEMRNPLNAIGMGLQRLQIEAPHLGDDHLQLIRSMREAVDRSNLIITSLRRYTHSLELSLEPVIPAAVLEGVMTLYLPLCAERSIRVTRDLDTKPVISGDKALLGQLFENVIKNAIEAQSDGGYLDIRLYRSGGDCVITLVNGGCTLGDEGVAHVFEPYFTRKSKGTGLGLPISRKIVEAHSGRCWCRVEGDEFVLCISFPLQAEGTATPA